MINRKIFSKLGPDSYCGDADTWCSSDEQSSLAVGSFVALSLLPAAEYQQHNIIIIIIIIIIM